MKEKERQAKRVREVKRVNEGLVTSTLRRGRRKRGGVRVCEGMEGEFKREEEGARGTTVVILPH